MTVVQENDAITDNDKSSKLEVQDGTIHLLTDDEWATEKLIDELQCNLALAEQHVTNKAGEKLTIKKYQSQCRVLGRWIPIALPTPEYVIYAPDLKPEVRRALEKIHHRELRRLVLQQAVLRLFEAVGIEPYTRIGRKLIVKLIGAKYDYWT